MGGVGGGSTDDAYIYRYQNILLATFRAFPSVLLIQLMVQKSG